MYNYTGTPETSPQLHVHGYMSLPTSSPYQEAVDHSDSTDQVAATHSGHKSQYKVALRFRQCRGWIINIPRRLN